MYSFQGSRLIKVAVMVTRERRFFTKHVPIPQTKQFERIWNIMPSGSRGKRGYIVQLPKKLIAKCKRFVISFVYYKNIIVIS